MRGETYLSPAVSRGIVSDYVQRLRAEDQPGDSLTPRQREVLQLVAEGHSTKEIARRLDLSVKTVDTHRSQLMKQLDIHAKTISDAADRLHEARLKHLDQTHDRVMVFPQEGP